MIPMYRLDLCYLEPNTSQVNLQKVKVKVVSQEIQVKVKVPTTIKVLAVALN